jgi:glycyl-tRNA synthetase beta chain
MVTLLLELFGEEIPSHMQAPAARELQQAITEALGEKELSFDEVHTDWTPRRLVVSIEGLPASQPDVVVEKRGPKVGAPEKALQGFLKSVGLNLDQLEERETPKGRFYFACQEVKGQATLSLLPDLISTSIGKIHWSKSMRWGANELRWVRPLHSILCLLDDAVVPFGFGHIESGRSTAGHRFLAPGNFDLQSAQDYKEAISAKSVVLSAALRKTQIQEQAQKLAQDQGLVLREDAGLLNEVVGLVEFPVVFMGRIDTDFMSVPAEILETAMRSHQKYFCVEDAAGKLAPYFIFVANIPGSDGGAAIVDGNERVLRARLSDAKYFWDRDQKQSLESRVPALAKIVFQARFGEGADHLSHKVERVVKLAGHLAQAIGADQKHAQRAAQLAKADLVSQVVSEFTDLQGLMGSYYAINDGEHAAVSTAILEHYRPEGPEDSCPKSPVSIAVALADKLDTLLGFFAAGLKPKRSKDPFGLRRAALGILRIIAENQLRLNLREVFAQAIASYPAGFFPEAKAELADDLMEFFRARLAVYLRDRDVDPDLIKATFSVGRDDDLTDLIRRIEAVASMLETDDGKNLLAGYRRAVRIVEIEEKKSNCTFADPVDESLLKVPQELTLFADLTKARAGISASLAEEDYQAAMASLASLRASVDQFFEEVMVNDDDQAIRKNRLCLLSQIRSALEAVADFRVLRAD